MGWQALALNHFQVSGATREFKSLRRGDLLITPDRLELVQRGRPAVKIHRHDVGVIQVVRVQPARLVKVATLGRARDMGPYLWIRSEDGTLRWHLELSDDRAVTVLDTNGWPVEELPSVGLLGALRRPVPFFECLSGHP